MMPRMLGQVIIKMEVSKAMADIHIAERNCYGSGN
jgi:hypothetical protein